MSDPARSPGRERRRWPRESQSAAASLPAPPVLKPLQFSTRQMSPDDQFAAWREHMASIMGVALPDGISAKDGFPALDVAWNLGSMLLIQQSVPAHSYMRTAAMLRASPVDHWYLIVPRSGRRWTEVDGRVAESHPGSIELGSLAYPFRGRTTDAENLVLYLPRDLISDATPILDSNINKTSSSHLAKLLIDYISSVEGRLHYLGRQDLGLVRTICDMLVATFPRSQNQNARAESKTSAALMARAREYIQRSISSRALTPETLSRAIGISRTRLYQLFESNGGVLHYIQKQRLLAAHAALSDSSETRRVGDVAESFGFSSGAVFSRAFKTEFGYSPRQARDIYSPRPEIHSLGQQDRFRSLEGWLKRLGG